MTRPLALFSAAFLWRLLRIAGALGVMWLFMHLVSRDYSEMEKRMKVTQACQAATGPKYEQCVLNDGLNCREKYDIWYRQCRGGK